MQQVEVDLLVDLPPIKKKNRRGKMSKTRQSETKHQILKIQQSFAEYLILLMMMNIIMKWSD